MIIRLFERAALTAEDCHRIRNGLLTVYGKLRWWRKHCVITEEELVLCVDRLKEVECVLLENLKRRGG